MMTRMPRRLDVMRQFCDSKAYSRCRIRDGGHRVRVIVTGGEVVSGGALSGEGRRKNTVRMTMASYRLPLTHTWSAVRGPRTGLARLFAEAAPPPPADWVPCRRDTPGRAPRRPSTP